MMMGEVALPKPKPNARDVFDVTSAVVETLIPGASLLKKYADFRLNRNIEEALGKLVEEIKKSGISVLTDEQFEFYLPSAYRFAEQVRVGEYEHNLKILRRILVDGLKASSTNSGKIGRHARQLEYLTEFEIGVLVASHLLEEKFFNERGDRGFVSAAGVISNIKSHAEFPPLSLIHALAILSSRGLLDPAGVTVWDQTQESYNVSPDGIAVIGAALKVEN